MVPVSYEIITLINGQSVFCEKIGEHYRNPNLIQIAPNQHGQTQVFFTPLCCYGNPEEYPEINPDHISYRYAANPEVIKMWEQIKAQRAGIEIVPGNTKLVDLNRGRKQ